MTGRIYDLQHGPLVLTQQRWKLLLMILGAFAFVAVGFWLLGQPTVGAEFAGLISVCFFGFCGIVGIAAVIWPARLTIGPVGLTLRTPFRTRRWAWRELDDLQLRRVRSTDVIAFRTRTTSGIAKSHSAGIWLPGNDGIPGGWPIGTRALFDLLTEAKARWDRQTNSGGMA